MSLDPESAWYADFFTELPNEFWRAATSPEFTSSEVDFLVTTAGLRPGSRVLDVPCGSGRHAMELARRGFRVTGQDVSAEAVEHARKAVARQGLDVDLRLGDMRSLLADGQFDATICLGNSFGYLEHAETRQFLLAAPGNVLVLDYGAVADSLLPHMPGELVLSFGGVDAVAVNSYDAATGRLVIRFTFSRGAETQEGICIQHVYTAAEVTRMVTAAGFGRVELYGDVDGRPFELGSPRLLLVARRP